MSTLPRSTGSFKRLRVVRLVSQLFRRRRRKSAKEPRASSASVSSPTPVLTNFSTMSLLLRCHRLSRSADLESSLASSPLSSSEMLFHEPTFSEDEASHCDQAAVDLETSNRSYSHESVFQADSFRPRKMIRSSRPGIRNTGTTGNGAATSLVDISNAGLRSELENKIFIRAKRLNSGTDDPAAISRSRPDSSSQSQPGLRGSTVESSSSLMSCISTSDMDLDRDKIGLESSRQTTITTTITTQTSHLYSSQQDVLLGVASGPIAQLLSHQAAKHRIAVKPKNRRPKSYQPKLEEPTWKPLPSLPAVAVTQLPDVVMDSDRAHHTASPTTVDAELTAVLSELEATYEILTTATPVSSEKPVRRVSYSKSFQHPRRVQAQPPPVASIKPLVSPRFTRGKSENPPPLPPKQFKLVTDDFRQTLVTKYRRTAGEPADDETIAKRSLMSEVSSSDTSVAQTSLFNHSVPGENPAGTSEFVVRLQDKHESTCLPSAKVETEIPAFIEQMDVCVSEIQSIGIESAPIVANVWKADTGITEDVPEAVEISNEPPKTLPKPDTCVKPVELPVRRDSLLSPTARLRQKTPVLAAASGQPELFKVLAKRSANLKTGKESSSDHVDSENVSARRTFSFKETLPASDAPVGKDFEARRSVFSAVATVPRRLAASSSNKENLPVDREVKTTSQSETLSLMRRNFFSAENDNPELPVKAKQPAYRKLSAIKTEPEESKVRSVSELLPTLRKVSIPSSAEDVSRPVVPDYTSILRRSSADPVPDRLLKPLNDTGSQIPVLNRKTSPENIFTEEKRPEFSFSLRKVSGESQPVKARMENTYSLRRSSLKHVDLPDVEMKPLAIPELPLVSSRISAFPVPEETILPGKAGIVDGFSRDRSPVEAVNSPKLTSQQSPIPENLPVAAAKDDQNPPPKSVSVRAALFQQKVEDAKPMSPRFGIRNTNIPQPSALTFPILRTVAEPPPSDENALVVPSFPTLKKTLTPVLQPKPVTYSGSPTQSAMWSAPVPVVPLKPVTSNKLTKTVSAQASCGSSAGASDMPAWVFLAQEKRKRLSMLSDSSDMSTKNSPAELHVVDASYA